MVCILSFISLGLVAVAQAKPLAQLYSRNDVAVGDKFLPHNDIKGFSEAFDPGVDGELERKFKPLLHQFGGCMNYPAVDVEGHHGAGLKPTNNGDSGCRDDPSGGQVAEGREAQALWLSVVVWLKATIGCDLADAASYAYAGISYSLTSRQPSYDKTDIKSIWTVADNGQGAPTHPILAYDDGTDIGPSSQGTANAPFNEPLIGWEALPTAAREQLNGIVYEHALMPLSDTNFPNTLAAAFSADFYEDVPADGAATNCAATTPTTSSTADSGLTTAEEAEQVADAKTAEGQAEEQKEEEEIESSSEQEADGATEPDYIAPAEQPATPVQTAASTSAAKL